MDFYSVASSRPFTHGQISWISALGQEVTSRIVRDHYNIMAKTYRARLAREERSTGEGGAELTEFASLLEELIDLEDEIDRQVESENE